MAYYNGPTPQAYGIAINGNKQIKTCYFNFYSLIYDPLGEPIGYIVTIEGAGGGTKVIDANYETHYNYEGASVSGWFIDKTTSDLASYLSSGPVIIRAQKNSSPYINATGFLYRKNQYTYAVDMSYNNTEYVWTLSDFYDDMSYENLTYVSDITEKSSGGGGGGLSYVFTATSYWGTEGADYTYYAAPSGFTL